MDAKLEQVFLKFSIDKLNQLSSRIADCLGKLSQDQVWARGSENENAVGNLVLHLCGNLRQWIGSGVAGKPDIRVRDREFAARGDVQPGDLSERLRSTVAETVEILSGLTGEQLGQVVTIQSYTITVFEAVYHVVEHFAQHAGQVLFITKMMTGEDLGYYRHLGKAAHGQKTP